ncbi:MAG: hypothetical protein PWQ63_249 [Methanolobus sp.]|jgi:hypothetical protein|nr:hypothetical protein [Methanolobus sp.]MDK2947089.1 hypothetical protein [Methanolobus sp.]
MKNELGMDVPPSVIKKAKEMGCNQGVKYVYKDGIYGDGLPASSIGGKKASRFGNIDSANANKVHLGSEWVAFMSPSYKDAKISGDIVKNKSKRNPSRDNVVKGTGHNNISELKSSSSLSIKREAEFFQGFIRLKISVTNNSSLVLTDVKLDFHYDEKTLHLDRHEPDYPSRNGKIELGNIPGGNSKSVSVYFEPMICTKGSAIKCLITYEDATGEFNTAKMKDKIIEVTCPILAGNADINIAGLRQLIESLSYKDNRIYSIGSDFDSQGLKNNLLEEILQFNIRHVRTLFTAGDGRCEMWFYSTTKVKSSDVVVRLSIYPAEGYVELFASMEDTKSLTGLLAEMGREVQKAIEKSVQAREKVHQVFNLNIRDSVIQRSNLLSNCEVEGSCEGDVVIENSVVLRSNVGKGA